MRAFIRGAGVLVILVSVPLGAAALAKGPVDRITIRGPGLDQPIEIVEAWVLNGFNPWAGQFLGDVLEDRPPALAGTSPYQVFFELSDQKGELRVVYAFSYYPGEGGHPGYIRLPGPGEEPLPIDEWYRTNIGTIIRSTDGHWHEATEKWGEVMSAQLGGTVGSANRTASAAEPWSTGWSGLWLLVVAAGAAVLLRLGVAKSQSSAPGASARAGENRT